MKNFALDTTSFAEQLGLYDFFNVLIYGATFVCGISIINENLCEFLWNDLSFLKGLSIVLLIYISGMLLQELGSKVDEFCTKLYRGMHRRMLKGKTDKLFDKETSNDIIKNPVVLMKYRNIAEKVLVRHELYTDEKWFDNENINGYIFSISQYYVSIKGKDKKVEKLRALFSMSKTLMSCFFLLTICAIATFLFNINMSINICSNLGFAIHGCEHCVDKIIIIVLFFCIGIAFRFRAKRTMRNFILVLLGTYNAILDDEEIDKASSVHGNGSMSDICINNQINNKT